MCNNLYYVSIQMSELENLGYAAFAFGYFEDDVQFTSTPTAHCCASSHIVEYLHSVIVAGMHGNAGDVLLQYR